MYIANINMGIYIVHQLWIYRMIMLSLMLLPEDGPRTIGRIVYLSFRHPIQLRNYPEIHSLVIKYHRLIH